MKEKIAEIIPLRRLSRNLDTFDYKIPLNMSVKSGQLVQISFRKRELLGVAINLKQKSTLPDDKLKYLDKIYQREPVITKQQFKLVDFMANYYFVAKSTIIKSMIPNFPKKRTTFLSSTPLLLSPTALSIPRQFVPWLKNEVKNFLSQKNFSSLTLPYQFLLYAFYGGLIKGSIKNNETVLILVPDNTELKRIFQKLNTIISKEKIALISSDLPLTQYYFEWEKVWKNRAKVIIGTRIASLLPFTQLNTIIVHLAENENHKSADQNPRFHTREVAYQLTNIFKSRLLFTGQVLSLELWLAQKNNLVKPLVAPALTSGKISLVSLKEEYQKNNYSGISEELRLLIKNSLARKKSVFLFINRKGEFSSYLCLDCYSLARCPECFLPFAIHKKNLLICHHCGRKISLYLKCPTCQGSNLKMIGFGSEKIEKELRNLFPKAAINRIEKDLPLKDEMADIFIGTTYALNNLTPPKNLGALGVIFADNLLNLPDFRAEEMTYQLLTRVVNFAEKPLPAIIQTFSPDNKTIKTAAGQNFTYWAKEELVLRKNLNWPPYNHLVKLIYQHPNAKIAKQTTEKLVDRLKDKIKNKKLIEVAGPLEAFSPRLRGKFRFIIIIKVKKIEMVELKNLIKLVPDDFIIDVDPITLL